MSLFKNRRKFVFLIFLVLPFFIAGCKPKTTDTDQITDQPVTLIWWNLFEPVENVRPIIEAYQLENPNVSIEYAERGLDDYRALLESNLTDGLPRTGPDIFTIHNTWIGTFEDFISPAPSNIIPAADFQTNFYKFVGEDFVGTNGLVIGVPMGVDTLAVIYNKDLLESAGYTVPSADWDDFKVQARDLTTKDTSGDIEIAGFSAATSDNTEFAFDLVNLLMLQSGGDILSSDGSSAVFGSDSDVQGALVFYTDFANGSNNTWDDLQEFDTAAFLEGKLAMYAAPSWRLLDIIQFNDQYTLGIDFGTAQMPQLENLEDERIYWPTYWGQTVSRDSASPDVAWDFLNFITQPDRLRTFHSKAKENRAFGELYPRSDMSSELANEQYLAPYIESFPFAKSWKMVDGDGVKLIFDAMLDSSTNSSISENLLEAQDGVNQVIDNKGNLGSQTE